MKAEEQIDQKQLLKMIKVLNDQYKTKIKTKGSITDLAEAFADGVETLSGKGTTLPEEVVDFFNDLFSDEAQGYKQVDVDDTEPVEEPVAEDPIEEEPLPEEEPPAEEDVEELPELEPEEELPAEEEEPLPEEEEEPLDELEELDEEEEPSPPPKRGRGRPATKKPEPKPTVKKPIEKKISKAVGDKTNLEKKETPSMLDQLAALEKKPQVKEFVKEHNINVKLKNNESVQVWKAKIKKLVEAACPAPAEPEKPKPAAKAKAEPKPAAKPAKKQNLKPKAETKAEKKPAAKVEPKKPVKKAEKAEKKAKKPRGDKDPFGVVVGSLTHSFVQAIYKKPQTMRMLIDAGIGKHPKTLKKMIAMGYMQRDKTGIISMTVNGRKVYGGGGK
jgi:hypothetical protein